MESEGARESNTQSTGRSSSKNLSTGDSSTGMTAKAKEKALSKGLLPAPFG